MPLIRRDKGAAAPPPAAGHGPEERWAAVREGQDAAALGADLAAETDLRVREAIFTRLVSLGGEPAVAALLPHLRGDDASLRTGALDALCALAPAVAGQLPALLRDEDADVRLLICEVARRLPSPAATQLLCGLLEGEREANVCAAAVEVLAEVGGAEAVPALVACAARFPDDPFLAFATGAAVDRIGAATRG